MYSTLAAFAFLVLTIADGGAANEVATVAFDQAKNAAVSVETLMLREELLREVSDALGIGSAMKEFGGDIDSIERVLHPIILASPKNEYGRLDDAASRYVLHRYFMQQHGWDMRTFISSGKSDAELTCLFDFGRPVPFAVQAALEKRVGDRGASIVELSVFIALLEHLVRNEVPSMVEAAYQGMGVARTASLDAKTAAHLIDFSMAAQISSEDASRLTPAQATNLVEQMAKGYGGWSFATEIFRSAQSLEARNATAISFSDVVRIVTRLQSNLTHVQNHQCRAMKANLLDIEVPQSGRVRLADFYDSALSRGNVEFMESLEYLRQLGAMDEQLAGDPQVVLTNYLDGPSNCIAASSYYSVCCLDDCVDLYMRLEDALKKPAATPEEIISVIRTLSTATTPEPILSEVQVGKLQEIAHQHVGLIELHGQSFAQWMHRVFPRECTDPSFSGPAHFMSLEEWAATSGLNVVESVGEARRIVEDAREASKGDSAEWIEDVEEEEDPAYVGEDEIYANATSPMSIAEFGETTQSGKHYNSVPSQAPQSHVAVAGWAPALRWVALALVAVLVPVKSLWSVCTQKSAKASSVRPRDLEAAMLELQASIMDCV